jgi:hypothetical protein
MVSDARGIFAKKFAADVLYYSQLVQLQFKNQGDLKNGATI